MSIALMRPNHNRGKNKALFLPLSVRRYTSAANKLLKTAAASCCVAILIFPRVLPAAEWYVEPAVGLTLTHNDNIFLRRTAIVDTSGAILNLDANIGARTERKGISLNTRFQFNEYSDSDALDTNNQFYNLASYYSAERGTWRLNGYYHRDSSVTSELEDTGVVQDNFRVKRSGVIPSWEHAFTGQTSLRVSYSDLDVDYERAAVLEGLFDFDTQRLNGTLTHQLGPTSNVFLTVYGFTQDVPQISSENDGYGATGGFGHAFSETLRVTLGAGVYRANLENTVAGVRLESDDTGTLLNASLEKQFELTTFGIAISQFVTPTGRGNLEQRRQLRISLQHRLTPTLTLSIPALAFRSEPSGGVRRDRSYYRVRPRLRWRVTRVWDFDASYRYIRSKTSGTDAAESNAVFATLTYNWPRTALAR